MNANSASSLSRIAATLAIGTAIACGASRQPASRKELSTQYRPRQAAISLHEPVVLLFAVHNGLSQEVTVTLGREGRQYFHF